MLPPLRGSSDFDHTLNRVVDGEDGLAEVYGFSVGKQGQAITVRYGRQLEQIIASNRESKGRAKAVWRIVGNTKNLSMRLLMAGISVCHGEKLGIDRKTEQKNLRDQTLWIGKNLLPWVKKKGVKKKGKKRRYVPHDTELALRLGGWGIDMLLGLP